MSGSLALPVSPLLINPDVLVDTQHFIGIADLLLRALLQRWVQYVGVGVRTRAACEAAQYLCLAFFLSSSKRDHSA